MDISNHDIENSPASGSGSKAVAHYFSPENPPWNSLAAIGLWLASVLFIIFFTNIFVAPYISGQSIDISDSSVINEFLVNDPRAVLLSILGVIPAHLFTIALAWVIVTRFNKLGFREMLGWKMNGFKIWHTFALVAFFFVVSYLVTIFFGDVENDFDKMLKSSTWIIVPIVFMAVFTAPLVEEVVYRGVLYSAFQRRFGVAAAVLFVTILFTSIHGMQYSRGAVPDYGVLSIILLLSLTLTLIRVFTKNLLPCIVLHTAFNGFQAILMIVAKFLPGTDGS